MLSRFPGKCNGCGKRFDAGAEVTWSRETGVTACPECSVGKPQTAPPRRRSHPPVPGERKVSRRSQSPNDGYEEGEYIRLHDIPGGGGPDKDWWVAFEVGRSPAFRPGMGYSNRAMDSWARVRPAKDHEIERILSVTDKKMRRDGHID